jgi:putative ABC transport system substrate-binding protein
MGMTLTLVLGLLTPPPAAQAQRPASVPRIGYLVLSPLAPSPTAEREGFLQGLRDLGYVDGQNLVIEYRSAAWNRELLPDLADELVRLKVSVIVAVPGAIEAAREATKTVPIVVPVMGDPVATGLVASLARPGGNITGTTGTGPAMGGKQLQLLKDAVPKISRVAVLWNPPTMANRPSGEKPRPPRAPSG